MPQAVMLSLTVICEDHDLAMKATETITRAQLGLSLEGMHTTLTISLVDYEEQTAEHENLD